MKVIQGMTFAGACAVFLLGFCTPSVAAGDTIKGAGSTFVQPILKQWADHWSPKSGATVVYDGVGSGAGIDKLKAKQVDFAATDAPLTEDELRAAGLRQFPIVAGGIVPVTNLRGVGRNRVKLTGAVLAQIFLGKVTHWDDPQIQAINAGFGLPNEPITVVHRGDSSGITYNFTAYLTKVSEDWASTLGTGKTVQWPVGVAVDGNTKLGVAVSETPNSIGYVEYGYALQHEMQIISLFATQERAIAPTQTTIRNAVESADWGNAKAFNILLVGIQGADTWPIAATTWIVLPRDQRGAPAGRGPLDFFNWTLDRGGELADAMGYTSLSPGLIGLIKQSWKN